MYQPKIDVWYTHAKVIKYLLKFNNNMNVEKSQIYQRNIYISMMYKCHDSPIFIQNQSTNM